MILIGALSKGLRLPLLREFGRLRHKDGTWLGGGVPADDICHVCTPDCIVTCTCTGRRQFQRTTYKHSNCGPVSRSADSTERTAAASRQQQRGDSRQGSNAAQLPSAGVTRGRMFHYTVWKGGEGGVVSVWWGNVNLAQRASEICEPGARVLVAPRQHVRAKGEEGLSLHRRCRAHACQRAIHEGPPDQFGT